MDKVKKVYLKLLSKYGRQGWWPVTPISCRGDAKPIYGVVGKSDKQRFEIIIGAILTQNTNWKNVEKAIIELGKRGLINRKKLIEIEHSELGQVIKSSGYFNQKAERLQIISKFLLDNPIEKLSNEKIPIIRKKLLNIKGIGPETADSILLYALEKPMFVVDAYTKRIFSRFGFKFSSYDELQKLFMSELDEDVELFNEYHALIVEHAKMYCKVKAECGGCVIKRLCEKDLNNTK
tara:strand:- start:129 stop:833 length:705 start_codon:yes stop_codon:yes gene_type:complete